MGYRVVYGNDEVCPSHNRIRVGRTVVMTIAVGALFVNAVCRFWPLGAMVLDKLTSFRGLREIHGYLDVLVLDIRSGTSFGQAVTAFCRDVVQLGMTYAA